MNGQSGASGAAQLGKAVTLAIRLDNTSRLFNTLDPYPFAERDLDPAAEDYLVAWVKEAPRGRPLRVEVLLPPNEAAKPEARDLPRAVSRYFAGRAEATTREMKELFRVGRISLMVGVPILGLCLVVARALNDAYDQTGFASVLAEGLVIAGWVANWRPIEIFLYDWWPIMRRRRRFERLAGADVQVVAEGRPAGAHL